MISVADRILKNVEVLKRRTGMTPFKIIYKILRTCVNQEHTLVLFLCNLMYYNNKGELLSNFAGDVLGCLLNIDEQYVLFFLNGVVCEQQCDHLFRHKR